MHASERCKKREKKEKLAGKRRESLTARLSSATSQYFQLLSAIRSRRNFSGYVPSAPSPSTLPRLPLIKNISPIRPGWMGNKHANSKCGICFPPKKSKRLFQASDEASPSPQVQPGAFGDKSPSLSFPWTATRIERNLLFQSSMKTAPQTKLAHLMAFCHSGCQSIKRELVKVLNEWWSSARFHWLAPLTRILLKCTKMKLALVSLITLGSWVDFLCNSF